MRLTAFVCAIFLSLGLYAAIQQDIEALHKHAYTLLDTQKDSAFAIGVRTEKMAKDAGLIWEEANSKFIQAWILEHRGASGEAFLSYIKALRVLEKEPLDVYRNQELYIQILGNTGLLLSKHQAYPQSKKFLNRSIQLAQQFNLYDEFSEEVRKKSITLRYEQSNEEAIEAINQVLKDSAKLSPRVLFRIKNEKGLVQMRQKKTKTALSTFNEILNATLLSDEYRRYQVLAHQNIGCTYVIEGNYGKGISALKQADFLNKESIEIVAVFTVKNDLANAQFLYKQFTDAIETGLNAIKYYKSVEAIPEHYVLFSTLSKSYAALGDYKEAQKYAEMYMTENKKYLETQEMLLKIKDEYKMEELTASFFMNAEDLEDKSLYWIILSIISSSFTVILLAGMTKNHLAKRALKKSLQEIAKDDWSEMLR